MDLLRVLASRENLAVLSALATSPEYPRRLAARLRRGETHISRRLRTLERAGFVQGSWAREDGKNVKLYRLKTRAFTVAIDQRGYQVQMPTLEVDRESSSREHVPVRRPIFGREQELARLSNPGGRFSMVVGLPGMGKTALATELAYRNGVERVLWHTFTPFDSAWRLLGLAKQWLALVDPRRGGELEKASGDIAELLDRVTDGLSMDDTLIVLDDYQKVRDDGIHEIVRRWQRTFARARVVVISRDRPPFDLDPTTQLVMLTGLDRAASTKLLQEYGMDPSSDDLGRLERAFGGHPLSLRLHAQQPGRVTGTARAMAEDVGREGFQTLDENSQHVLLALAAVRRPLGLEGIRFLTGLKELGLPLAVLERRAMIRSDGSVYRIHDVLRESLAPTLASHPELHRRATALFLPSDHGDDIVEALYHATKAKDWSVAGNLLELDLEKERDMPSSSVSATVFLEILNEIPTDELSTRHRAIFHRSHALACLGIAKTEEVTRELQNALRIAEPLGDPKLLSWILSPLGYYLGNSGRMTAAERVLLRNLHLMESAGGATDRADARLMLALLYDRRGDHGLAKRFWKLALAEAYRTGNRRLVLEFGTWHVAFPSDWRAMLPRLRRWRADFRRWEMPRQVESIDILAGEILCRAERYRPVPRKSELRRAIKFLGRAITGCGAIGNRFEALYARSWLALALCLAGEFERAEAEANETLAGIRKIGAGHAAIFCHQALGRVCQCRGDIGSAIKHSEQAVRIARRFRCGCLGIAQLERVLLAEEAGNKIALDGALESAIAETIRTGYPDEAAYAREVARRHRVVVNHGPSSVDRPLVIGLGK